jgi:hypothetical protein
MTATQQPDHARDTAVVENTDVTFIEFVLDETGSMQSCYDATLIGYDDFVAEQRKQIGACYLTLSKFDSMGIRTPYENLPIEMVTPLTFEPGQMTNLYDTIEVRLAAALGAFTTGKALFVIMTDGADNQSRPDAIDRARDLIIRAQDSGMAVLFLGPTDSALNVGKRLGVHDGNIKSFHTTKMRETMRDVSTATKAFRAGTADNTNLFA